MKLKQPGRAWWPSCFVHERLITRAGAQRERVLSAARPVQSRQQNQNPRNQHQQHLPTPSQPGHRKGRVAPAQPTAEPVTHIAWRKQLKMKSSGICSAVQPLTYRIPRHGPACLAGARQGFSGWQHPLWRLHPESHTSGPATWCPYGRNTLL